LNSDRLPGSDTQPPLQSSAAPQPLPGYLPLAPQLLSEVMRVGEVREHPRGEVLARQGERAQEVMFLLEGRLLCYVTDPDAVRSVDVCRVEAGDLVGLLVLLDEPRRTSIRTLVRSRICHVHRDVLEALLMQQPAIGIVMMKAFGARAALLTDSLSAMLFDNVYARMIRLFETAARTVDKRRLVPSMSQQAIARRIGASRSMVNRILKELVAGGYVAMGEDCIEIRRSLPRRW